MSIVKNNITGIEKKSLSKEKFEEILVESFVESRGDQDLFYEFLSIKINNTLNKDVSYIEIGDNKKNVWKVNIFMKDDTSMKFNINMSNIKIPEKYL